MVAKGESRSHAMWNHSKGVSISRVVRGPFQACTLGFSIARASEGRGRMTTVVSTGVGIMFDDYGLHRIMANHMPHNDRSRRVLERCGFVREGYAKAYLKIAGRWEDHVLTALVNSSLGPERG